MLQKFQTWIVTLGAGVASMLLFILSAKGSVAAMIVTYFTPLPIMIAALGWGPVSGLAAAAIGAAIPAVALDPIFGIVYALAFGLPAWWLGHIALLARFDTPPPAAGDTMAGVQREWYPLGRLVTWAAAVAVVPILVGLFSIGFIGPGFDAAVQAAAVRAAPVITEFLSDSGRLPAEMTVQTIAVIAIKTLPVVAAASLTLLLLVNLWLAGRTVEMSHRLSRPWPPLPENLRLPRMIFWAFPILVVLGFVLKDSGALVVRIPAAAAGLILALQGLAVIHALTRRRSGRFGLLVALYLALALLMPWSLLCCVVVGWIDAVYALRDRRPRIHIVKPRL